jgi:hypothetical protein
MKPTESDRRQIALAEEYFRRVDAGRADLTDLMTVEGTTRGQMKNGKSWAAGTTPGGRFCNVFQFRGQLISRLHIYLDPDYVSEDAPRFLWGKEDRTW